MPSARPDLPVPSGEAQALSAALEAHIRAAIDAAGGWISFARFMELALYAPGLGYYSAGATKLGPAGDFITAPEFSPLYARCIARQAAELIGSGLPDLIELGAGSGALAAGVLAELASLGRVPERYLILEVSAPFRERQLARLAAAVPELADRVQWLDVLPAHLEGVLIANEVLDAIPTQVVRTRGGSIEEMGVTLGAAGFERAYRPATRELARVAAALGLPDGYETEVNLAAPAFVKSFARLITRGVLLFIDYGFPSNEYYYHPQRAQGTLMCHYRHRSHDDPFYLVGLQDITAHVDFTAIAAAGVEAGLSVLGYATQAQFLINTGITEFLSETQPDDVLAYAPLAAQVQKLVSPAEMGELFKVLALGRGVETPLVGFSRGDRTHTL